MGTAHAPRLSRRSQLEIRHEGHPPHTVELLRKLNLELCTTHGRRTVALPNHEGRSRARSLDRVQAREARGVLGFRPHRERARRCLYASAGAAAPLDRAPSARNRRHRHSDRVLIAFSQRGGRLSRAQQLARSARPFSCGPRDDCGAARNGGAVDRNHRRGRSGSAFAAEIGVMQLNEETDALRHGLDPIRASGRAARDCVDDRAAAPQHRRRRDGSGRRRLLSLVQLHIPAGAVRQPGCA